MTALKPVSFFQHSRRVLLAFLVGVLFLSNSASVNAQGPTSDSYAKQLPAGSLRSHLPQALAPAQGAAAANIIQDPSFEAAYNTINVWGQFSTNFGTPLCIVADCGDGAGTATPRSGAVWAWFGGVPDGLEQSGVTQSVTLPSCGATLKFYFWIGRAAPGSDADDYFRVSLNREVQLFESNATQVNSYPGYKLVTINIAPGTYTPGTNVLVFESETTDQIVNFNMDDVALIPNCIMIAGHTGVAGTKITYTGGSTTTDSNGNYVFNIPAGWSGTVTPSRSGYRFSPPSKLYSNVVVSQLDQNFTPTALYTISGTTGVGWVTLSYTDGTPKTVTSAGNGDYSFIVPENWSGKVTPAHPCFTFSPASRNYDGVVSNQMARNYSPTAVPAANCTDINISVGGGDQGQFFVPPQGSTRASFAGLNNGPAQIESTDAVPLIGAERVIYKVNGVQTSFTELMGLPDGQLDTTYWLPWYNNVDLDTQLRIANATNTPAVVTVTIGGVEMPVLNLAAGESTRVSYPSVNDGPVKIESDQEIVAAERVIYKVNKVQTSFSEMMALPASQLGNVYWLPWYNNVDLDTQLRIANVTDQTASVQVFIGGVEMEGSRFDLEAGESTRLSFPGVNGGPVRIVSDRDLVASERVLYKVNGVNTSFSEMMAISASQLNTTYWLPWYNNVDLDTQLRFANTTGSIATVRIYVGGVEMNGSPFTLQAGESTRQSFAGINNGPVQITSDRKIVVAERVLYKVNGVNTSFSEMMALPNPLLDTIYWFPWYNNVDLDTQLRFGVP